MPPPSLIPKDDNTTQTDQEILLLGRKFKSFSASSTTGGLRITRAWSPSFAISVKVPLCESVPKMKLGSKKSRMGGGPPLSPSSPLKKFSERAEASRSRFGSQAFSYTLAVFQLPSFL